MSAQPKRLIATMTIPAGARESWSRLMAGAPVDEKIEVGTPVVQAHAVFHDGTQVVGGVLKGEDPQAYNVKFMWVFDRHGRRYPGWPIDVSDHEDFRHGGYRFGVDPGDEEGAYELRVVEEPAS